MSDVKLAKEALQKIQSILDEVKEVFPIIEKLPKNTRTAKGPVNHVKLLRRAQGIIKDFNEESAERKLKNLIAFMEALRKRL